MTAFDSLPDTPVPTVLLDAYKEQQRAKREAASPPPEEPGYLESFTGGPDGDETVLPPLEELTDEEIDEDHMPDAIIEDLIHEGGTHNVPGPGKVGKSYLAIQAAMCVATGHRFLDLEVKRGPVLYVSLEMTAAIIRERKKGIARDMKIPNPRNADGFHLVARTWSKGVAIDLQQEAHRNRLRDLIVRKGAKFVVLDTLFRFHPGGDPNSNAEMALLYGQLNDMSLGTGAAFLILDHTPKGVQDGPTSHAALGAQAKGSASWATIHLRGVSTTGGGTWEVSVVGHLGDQVEPITYQRPLGPDGEPGEGCERCGAAESRGASEEVVRKLFLDHGTRDDEEPRPHFKSKADLVRAIQAKGLVRENSTSEADDFVAALVREYCVRAEHIGTKRDDGPILLVVTGPHHNSAKRFIWRLLESEDSE